MTKKDNGKSNLGIYPVLAVEPSSRAQAEGSLPFEGLRAVTLSNRSNRSNRQVERKDAACLSTAMTVVYSLEGQRSKATDESPWFGA